MFMHEGRLVMHEGRLVMHEGRLVMHKGRLVMAWQPQHGTAIVQEQETAC